MAKTLKVLYILGFERSGSTIVHNVLGQGDGYFSVGELRDIWKRFNDNRPCGCGKDFLDCQFWKEVYSELFSELPELNSRLVPYIRDRYFPFFMSGLGRFIHKKFNPLYYKYLSHLYRITARNGASKVIVDSSKSLVHCANLATLEGIELHVIHLTRDPRGIEYSLLKRKKNGHPKYQNHSPVISCIKLVLMDYLFRFVGNQIVNKYLHIRYEDFVNNPEKEIKKIQSFVGNENHIELRNGTTIELNPTHSVGGSPSRHNTGEIALRPDTKWKNKLPFGIQKKVEFWCKKLIDKYGYQRESV